MSGQRIEIPDERIAVTIGDDGYLAAVEPLTGLDPVPSYPQARRAAALVQTAPGTELRREGWLTWKARRVCQCVLPEQHCPACDAAALRANNHPNPNPITH